MSDFAQAVNVTILGMGLVFASLGLLMVIIMGLLWVLRERPKPALAPTPAPSTAPFILDTDPEPPHHAPEVSDEVVAAIAVALAAWQRQQEASRPPQTTVVTFAPGTSGWRALGRLS